MNIPVTISLLPNVEVPTSPKRRQWVDAPDSYGGYISFPARILTKRGVPHSPNPDVPAITSLSDYVNHEEYHYYGHLHNWEGPAIVYNGHHEYFLFGACVDVGIFELLTDRLDRHRCQSEYGRVRKSCDFDPYEFLNFCYRNYRIGATGKRQCDDARVYELRIPLTPTQLPELMRLLQNFLA